MSAYGQKQLSGTVRDAETNEPMIGVTVRSSTGQGTVTDYDGAFRLAIKQDSCTLTLNYLGYKTMQKRVVFSGAETVVELAMQQANSTLDLVTVSTSRYEKNVLKEGVSIDIISPTFLANNQITQLDQMIAKVPGVQIIDEQASVRGSGFSFGAGSRVSIIVDGLPLLAPEGANIPWNYLPIENIAQIEVLKGATSVQYGTSAMNGLISVQTAYPTSKPKTTWQTYASLYDNPKKAYQIWWTDKPQPHLYGTYISHRTKVGEKFDLVLGGHTHKELSFLQGADERRSRFNFNTRYRLTDKLSVGINGNVMELSKGFWGFWKDGDTSALIPSARIVADRYFSRNFDPYLNYFDPFGNQHAIKTRLYSVTFLRLGNSPNTTARVNHFEYQYNRAFKKNLHLTAGISRQILSVSSPIFGLDSILEVPKTLKGSVNSFYAQADKGFFKERLNLTLGTRWERYAFEEEEQLGFPVFRAAGSFAITPKNIIRANVGQGYRLPSIAEQFVDYNNGLQNFPNTALRPEIGANYEIGYKRAFDRKAIQGYLDAAVFFMDYTDLIEPVFGFYNEDTTGLTIADINNYGFQFQNITKANILGFELGGTLNGNLGGLGYRLWSGYTYTFPIDLSRDTVGLDDPLKFIRAAANSVVSLDSAYLKSVLLYRNLHNFRFDLELTYQKITLGFAANYQSRMINIDDVLVGEGYWGPVLEFFNSGNDVFPGMKQYRREHTQGDWVFDVRLNYAISPNWRMSFIVNNALNYEYALRIGKVSPPRQFTFKLEVSI
jgi:outer membrane receptor protein involved in Fe transport